MIVTEIFKSIQGESSFAGLPCSFVRTTGCNLRCVWCDTEYAFHGGTEMTVPEVFAKVESHNCKLVELTGGEPLLQADLPELSRKLLDSGYTVLLETGGALDIRVVPSEVIKILDVKCPDSGMTEQMNWDNLNYLNPADELKFVINSREDYEWAAGVVRERELSGKNLVLFSPVYKTMPPEQLAEWILSDNLPVRFQIQLHKVLWGETPGK